MSQQAKIKANYPLLVAFLGVLLVVSIQVFVNQRDKQHIIIIKDSAVSEAQQ